MNNTTSNIKVLLPKAILGGFLATIVFTFMGKFLAPHILGKPMDVAAILAPMLGGSHTAGVMLHFIMGTLLFPIAYLLLGLNNLKGSAIMRGAQFLFVIYLVAMIVVMPMMGQGLFFGNPMKAMVALMAHIVFGLIMGGVIGLPKQGNSE